MARVQVAEAGGLSWLHLLGRRCSSAEISKPGFRYLRWPYGRTKGTAALVAGLTVPGLEEMDRHVTPAKSARCARGVDNWA